MSKAKDKGTAWETASVNYLIERGAIYAERRALRGINDRGDISGIPGVVIENKSCKTIKLSEWVDEVTTERNNAGGGVGMVWMKRIGRTSVARGYAIMEVETSVDLLIGAGYFVPLGGAAA
jgi:hypothetical protein